MTEYIYAIEEVNHGNYNSAFARLWRDKMDFCLENSGIDLNLNGVSYFFREGKAYVRFYNQKENLGSRLNSFFGDFDLNSNSSSMNVNIIPYKTKSGRVGIRIFSEIARCVSRHR